MSDLAAFNQLTERTVIMIQKNFAVNAFKLCKDNGIIYTIK